MAAVRVCIEALGLFILAQCLGQFSKHLHLSLPHAVSCKGGYLFVHLAGGSLGVGYHHECLPVILHLQAGGPCAQLPKGTRSAHLFRRHVVIKCFFIIVFVHLEGKNVQVVYLILFFFSHRACLGSGSRARHLQFQGHFRFPSLAASARSHLAREFVRTRGGKYAKRQ